ncbi:MAG: hypothetical protein QG567_1047 [Campylobacterota bacterium]|nr:hypothetical protein [Campylobacterota bacterium]
MKFLTIETVYFSESDKIDLSFEEIKEYLKKYRKNVLCTFFVYYVFIKPLFKAF